MPNQAVSQPLTASETPAPVPAPRGDLATCIGWAEQRLVAREQRLLSQAKDLSARARQAAEPAALLLKLAGVAAAGAGAVWALRRRRGRAAPPGLHSPAAPVGAPPALLLSLLPMAWPMLPARWRSRVSPATAATLLGVAVPLIQRLLARRGPAAATAHRRGPSAVAQLDLLRYAGTWHEQARLPQAFERFCAGQPRAIYTPQGDQLRVRNECRSADGRLRAAEGVARVVPGSGGARLQLSFMPAWLRWLPFGWSDLWVLHVDDEADDYRVAIAGHPSRQGLWLLSRRPRLPADELQRLVALASDMGFDTRRLVMAGPPPTLR